MCITVWLQTSGIWATPSSLRITANPHCIRRLGKCLPFGSMFFCISTVPRVYHSKGGKARWIRTWVNCVTVDVKKDGGGFLVHNAIRPMGERVLLTSRRRVCNCCRMRVQCFGPGCDASPCLFNKKTCLSSPLFLPRGKKSREHTPLFIA